MIVPPQPTMLGDSPSPTFPLILERVNSGRFLDPPEFAVMHDKDNEENVFDWVDYRFSDADWILLNLGYTRSWFPNPNSFDQQFHNVNGIQLTNPPLASHSATVSTPLRLNRCPPHVWPHSSDPVRSACPRPVPRTTTITHNALLRGAFSTFPSATIISSTAISTRSA